ncbi:MAG: DUF177 domain-containing protein [Thermodesulfobacteriota bacterium]|nr:DUF177 domain-containing protein [Thermodesulfobacteriota bacterium]
MRLELKDIKGGVLEQEYSCTLSDFPDLIAIAEDGGSRFSEPLEFQLRLQRTGQFVEVDGCLNATVGLQCGRCLQSFEQSLSESFVLTFSPLCDEDQVAEEVELEAEELGLIVYEDDLLELQEPLQEQLLMAIPINPLCTTSCQGLCPECGENLNVTRCDCVKKPFNNKFTALADIEFKGPE